MSRRLIYSMGVSLDGYIAGPGGEGDWAAPDAELHRFHNEQARELDLHLLGRRLYEVMTYWETAEERDPAAPEHELEFARIWKRLPKLVYSKSLESVEGNTRLSRADPVQEVQALKEQVVQLRVDLAAMKTSIEAGHRNANAQFTRIG